jgi:cyclophilin family peptidyl-prolyl cis-trans isomerase
VKRARRWLAAGASAGALLAGSAQAQAQSPAPGAGAAAATEAAVETDSGTFVIRLRPDLAPAHVRHFLKTARAGGYDHTTFHRIIPGGIIQGGDPLSKDPAKEKLYGTGGLGLLKAEFSQAEFARGVVAAARKPSGVDTGGSQFFICLRDQPALKGQYTIFGEVSEGMDVVDRIGATPVQGDRPQSRVEIRSVTPRAAAAP